MDTHYLPAIHFFEKVAIFKIVVVVVVVVVVDFIKVSRYLAFDKLIGDTNKVLIRNFLEFS